MVRAIFAGSFDPPTFGHLNIIERARKIFDEIHVVVAINSEKKCLFHADERIDILQKLTKHWENVKICSWDSLIVDYAKKNNASVLIRGIRNMGDFSYEFDLSLMNKALDSNIETVFFPTEPKYFVLRSSSIKELAALKGDVSSMVPKIVEDALKKKFN